MRTATRCHPERLGRLLGAVLFVSHVSILLAIGLADRVFEPFLVQYEMPCSRS